MGPIRAFSTPKIVSGMPPGKKRIGHIEKHFPNINLKYAKIENIKKNQTNPNIKENKSKKETNKSKHNKQKIPKPINKKSKTTHQLVESLRPFAGQLVESLRPFAGQLGESLRPAAGELVV